MTRLPKSVWSINQKKHGNVMHPGLSADVTAKNIDYEKRQKDRKNNLSNDTANRKQVANEIAQLIEEGNTIEEAVQIVSKKPENMEKFDYLIKAGVNLENTFKNIYLGSLRSNSINDTYKGLGR